jgi:hypothetical protein
LQTIRRCSVAVNQGGERIAEHLRITGRTERSRGIAQQPCSLRDRWPP